MLDSYLRSLPKKHHEAADTLACTGAGKRRVLAPEHGSEMRALPFASAQAGGRPGRAAASGRPAGQAGRRAGCGRTDAVVGGRRTGWV